MDQLSPLVEKIINYEKSHNMTDSDLAFASHISVEHIHSIKSMSGNVDPKVVNDLNSFIDNN